MQIHKSKLTASQKTWIQRFYKTKVENTDILYADQIWSNRHIFVRVLLAIPIYWFLFYFVLSWNEEIYLYAIAFLVSLLVGDLVDFIYAIRNIQYQFIAYDKLIVIRTERNIIEYFPIYELKQVDFEKLDAEYFNVKLTFPNGTIQWPQFISEQDKARLFSNSLIELSNQIKKEKNTKNLSDLINQKEFSELEKQSYQFITSLDSEIRNKRNEKLSYIQRNLITIPSVIVFFVIQIIAIPYLIDFIAFKHSEEKNTASAYRNYLSNPRNKLYRREAEKGIHVIYTEIIDKLTINNEDYEKAAMIKTLEYLRDNNIYSVNLRFNFSSRVKDISRRGVLVISAENSFTRDKNDERENALIKNINSSIGKIFPTDIISFDKSITGEVPYIEINYTYLNSKDNSLYYPVSQESLPDNSRTYYYGISVSWDFKWYIPTDTDPIAYFKLISNPALQFSTESLSSNDVVYSNMIYTAFNEMASEFSSLYLPPNKID